MKLILIILLTTLVVSCDTNENKYSLITANRSDEVVDEVRVWYKERSYQIGIVSPESSKTISGAKIKLLDVMKITWIDAGMKAHEQVFNTFDFIPDDYSEGNVIFTYQGGGEFILEFYMPKNNFPKLSEQ